VPQRCHGLSQYDQCSTNNVCGCLHSASSTGSSICGFRWLTCSELVSCVPNTHMCFEPDHVCVSHPDCHDLPLCYPLSMASQELCPPIPTSTTTCKLNPHIFLSQIAMVFRHTILYCLFLSPFKLFSFISSATIAGSSLFNGDMGFTRNYRCGWQRLWTRLRSVG
jgi:hypothetical protein